MIIKKILAICKDAGIYNIIDDQRAGLQWLGSDRALYPLEGCPIFDEDSLCATFDIPDKKREKLMVARHAGFDVLHGATPYDAPGEEEYHPMDMVGLPGVGGMMVLTNGEKVLFIPHDYMEPLGLALSELTFWARRDELGLTYILIRRGIVAAALIWTRDVLSERYVQDLREYTALCSGEQMRVDEE